MEMEKKTPECCQDAKGREKAMIHATWQDEVTKKEDAADATPRAGL